MRRTGYFNSDRLPANRRVPICATRKATTKPSPKDKALPGSGAGGVRSTAANLVAFDDALRRGRLLNTEWTHWVLGGEESADRCNISGLAIRGGGPGMRAQLDSNGVWPSIVLSNVDGPAPFDIAAFLARGLGM